MTLRIGINPIGWSNDDLPELGGDIPLEQCLREAKVAGYAGMELGRKGVLNSPAENADLLYEYFPLSVDDW